MSPKQHSLGSNEYDGQPTTQLKGSIFSVSKIILILYFQKLKVYHIRHSSFNFPFSIFTILINFLVTIFIYLSSILLIKFFFQNKLKPKT